jgi:hypothetical protein
MMDNAFETRGPPRCSACYRLSQAFAEDTALAVSVAAPEPANLNIQTDGMALHR